MRTEELQVLPRNPVGNSGLFAAPVRVPLWFRVTVRVRVRVVVVQERAELAEHVVARIVEAAHSKRASPGEVRLIGRLVAREMRQVTREFAHVLEAVRVDERVRRRSYTQ